MKAGPDEKRIKAQLRIWWIVWAGILSSLLVSFVALTWCKPLPAPKSAELLVNLGGFVPLFVSIVVRWLVLPRDREAPRALIIFIIGLVLAETCGLLGIFLGGAYRDALFVLGALGIVQYIPFYARKFYEPLARDYLPNH